MSIELWIFRFRFHKLRIVDFWHTGTLAKSQNAKNWELRSMRYSFFFYLQYYWASTLSWVMAELPLLANWRCRCYQGLGKGCVNNTIHLLRSFRILFFKIFWKLKFWVGQKSSRNLIFMSLTWKNSIRDIRDMPKTKRQTSKR